MASTLRRRSYCYIVCDCTCRVLLSSLFLERVNLGFKRRDAIRRFCHVSFMGELLLCELETLYEEGKDNEEKSVSNVAIEIPPRIGAYKIDSRTKEKNGDHRRQGV